MAAQFEKHFVQDLAQDIKIRQCGTIVFNADNESNIISVDLYTGSEEYSGGGTVTGACICPDGSTVPLTGSISGKTASVTLTGDCFAFPGQIGIGVQVTSGTVKTTVLKAIYNVELFETDTVVDPGSRITMSVSDLIQDINDALANIPASDTNLKAAMAPVFSTSTAYQAGQYVWHEGQLYKFTADHAAGTWTGTDAGLSALGNDVADLKSAVNSVAVIPANLCYVTDEVEITRYGASFVKAGKNSVNVYGTSTGIGYYRIFNGDNASGNTGTPSPTKFLSKGTYTVFLSGVTTNKLEVYMTESDVSSRVLLADGQIITVGDNGAGLLVKTSNGKDYGTSENPTVLTVSVYAGSIESPDPTAVDNVARDGVEECESDISTASGRIDDCESALENADARLDHVEDSVFYNYVPNINWAIGGITSNGTINSTFKYCIRPYGSATQFPVNGVISCDEGYDIRLVRYSDSLLGSGNFISDTGWTSEPQNVQANEWIAVCVRNANDTSTVLTDTSISSHVRYDFKTPCYMPYQRSPFYRNISAYPSDFSGWYETNQTFTEGFNENTMYADVIAAFDTLVSESGGYLTKADIGTITSVDGQGNAYHIYEYTFAPKRYTGSYLRKTAPTILLECSAHGFEKNSTYAVYYFLKDILKNWSGDNILAAFRRGVTLKIVPSSNPWGFDHNDRLNENGVNLNRNYYNPNWEPNEEGTSNYGGTEPFSEVEAQVIRDWVLANKKAFTVINVHTNGQYNSVGYPEANALMPVKGVNDPYYNMIYDACRAIINDQTIRLPDEINALSGIPYNKMIGKIQDGGITETSGTMPKWVVLQGIISMTLEVFNGLNEAEGVSLITRFTADSFKAVTEIFGNGLAKILKEYAGK